MTSSDTVTFPDEDISDNKKLAETHNLIQATPFGEKKLAYSLLLPKNWLITKDMGVQKMEVGHPTIIGSYVEAAKPDTAQITVMFTPVPFEISLMDWARYLGESYKTKLTMIREKKIGRRMGVEAGGTYKQEYAGEAEAVIRFACFVDGPGIYIISAMAPKSRYKEFARDFALAVGSLDIQTPFGNNTLENLSESTVKEPDFKLAYPASWIARPLQGRIKGKSALDLLQAEGEALLGYVRVKAIDPKIVGDAQDKELVDIATQEMQDANVIVSGGWHSEQDSSLREFTGFKAAYYADGLLQESKVELRFCILRRGGFVFVITALSKCKADDMVAWLRTRRMYEMAAGTVKPG